MSASTLLFALFAVFVLVAVGASITAYILYDAGPDIRQPGRRH